MNHEEFSDFFRRDYSGLMRHVRMLGHDRETAADAAQQAMVLLFEQTQTHQVRAPRAWVRIVARRLAMHDRTRNTKRDQLHAQQAAQAPLASCTSPEEAALEASEAQRVLEIIAQLPPQQRQVLAWHYDGFTAKEIAEILDLKRSTVDSNLRHARDRVKARLAQFVLVGEGRSYERPSV
ncbi:sigma-70 family RNA polymerase sigma factor [Streptomyces griseorubiginosus]|uniref:RNA polymerase sigma factor n=1 Tax=Streptomyces griseorubiginosus TaxID=67304 RepID=UPI0033A4FE71